MEPKKVVHSHEYVVDNLRRLPRKMLLLHGRDNVTEFVLHELCKNCFNMHKAAYFIDNPDFNCLKGVVGVSTDELSDINDIWNESEKFSERMTKSPFNQKVRSFEYQSHKKKGDSHDMLADIIAKELGFKNYNFYTWTMKHDNHGFLLCEKNEEVDCEHPKEDVILDGLSLLSFCPVH